MRQALTAMTFLTLLLPGVPTPARPAPRLADESLSIRQRTRMAPSAAPAALPLRFEPNVGQTDPCVRFLARAGGSTLYFTDDEAVFALGSPAQRADAPGRSESVAADAPDVVRMKLLGASWPERCEGLNPLPGVTNYVIGNDPSRWRTGVPGYGKVRMRGVYPGVDVVYYAGALGFEYDFVVAAGADLGAVRLGFEGVSGLRIDASGDLVARAGEREFRQARPVAYQEDARGVRVPVQSRFVLGGMGEVSFEVGAYDRSRPLVVDPVVLSYGTYLGGISTDQANDVAVDAAGMIYLAGSTSSPDFPMTGGPPPNGASFDAYVARFDPSDSSLAFVTFLGGTNSDFARDIEVDATGAVYLAGASLSPDFPTLNPLQTYRGEDECFVAKLAASGSMVYSTFLGGSQDDTLFSLDVDLAGSAYVAGATSSPDFPTVGAIQQFGGGSEDAFVAKLSPSGSSIIYSTFVGGTEYDRANSLLVDSSGNAYIVGETGSADFPTVAPFQAERNGFSDGFVCKLSVTGSALLYSTYLGGMDGDGFADLWMDDAGALFATGYTTSPDFPLINPVQDAYRGSIEGVIVKLAPSGANLEFSTYFGDQGFDFPTHIQVDATGAIFVMGTTSSTNLPLVDPLDSTLGGSQDAFVVKIGGADRAVVFSTYLGGSSSDSLFGFTIDGSGNLYIVGLTTSADFPTTPGTLQPAFGGGARDGFLVKLSDTYTLDWDVPDTIGTRPPPRNLSAVIERSGDSRPTPEPASPGGVTGYKVYRSPSPNVTPTAGNLFTTVPANQTALPGASGGFFYVVTACYDDDESNPSNEVGAGTNPGAAITKVKLTGAKVTAKGTGFTPQVEVFVDGIPFASPAKVKGNRKKVTQTGTLATGETLAQYLASHPGPIAVGFRNSDGGLTSVRFSR